MSAPLRHPRFDRDDRPFLVIWEVTQACALSCLHCRAEAQPHRHPFELSRAEARAVFREIRQFGDPPPLLVLTGGDPLSRPDLLDLVDDAQRAGLSVSLSPSVTPLVTAESLTQLHDQGVKAVAFSLDGANAETHDGFRATPGVFDATLRAWHQARELKLKVQINTTVTAANVRELPEIVNLIRTYGVMTWSVFFLVPTGRASHELGISSLEAEDVLHFLYDAGHLVSVKATEAHHYRRVALQRALCERRGVDPVEVLGLGETYRWLREQLTQATSGTHQTSEPPTVRRPPLQVSAGRGFCFISHTGDIFPSGFLPVAGGNVRTDSLAHSYRASVAFQQIRDTDRLGGRCGRCEFREVCGGSRARAYATTGDVMAEDPLCSYEPGSFRWSDEAMSLARVD